MHRRLLPCLLAPALLLTGCMGDEEGASPPLQPTPAADGNATLALESTAFAEGEPIPVAHTCDGENLSPPLRVSDVPADAEALALTVVDPDVPTPLAPVQTFTHWVLWNAPVENGTVVFPEGEVPNGTVEGANEGGGTGWTGPCPPPGSPAHRYVFTAYALDAPLNLTAGATRAELEQAMEGHVLATGNLTGTYARRIGP